MIALLELLDVTEKSVGLLSALVDLIVKLGVDLFASVDLGLKILDRAIDVAKRTLLGAVLVLLLFEVCFQLLQSKISTRLISLEGVGNCLPP